MKLTFNKFGSGLQSLVILHGLLGSKNNWNTVAKILAREHTVFVPDLRNHGNSPHGKHSIEAMTDDILEMLQNENIENPVVLGHSMGGFVAMKLAVAYPNRLRGLVVVDIAPTVSLHGLDTILEAMVNVDLRLAHRREDVDDQLKNHITSKATRQFLLQNLKRQADGRFHWRCNLPELQKFVQQSNTFTLAPEEKYPGPTLFIAGGKSAHQIGAKEHPIRQHFLTAEIHTIQGAGHWVHFEAQQDFVNEVNWFMKAVNPTPPAFKKN